MEVPGRWTSSGVRDCCCFAVVPGCCYPYCLAVVRVRMRLLMAEAPGRTIRWYCCCSSRERDTGQDSTIVTVVGLECVVVVAEEEEALRNFAEVAATVTVPMVVVVEAAVTLVTTVA